MRAAVLVAVLVHGVTAQTPPQTVGGSASRTILIGADEAVVDLNVTTINTFSLEALLRVLQPLGVRPEHLTSVSLAAAGGRFTPVPLPPGGPTTPAFPPAKYTYAFLLTAAPSEVSQVIARLQEAFRMPVAGVLNWSAFGSLSASDAALEANRVMVLPELFAAARRRADQWRQPSGITAGNVVFVSDNVAPLGRTVILQGPSPFPLSAGTRAAYTVSLRMGQGPRIVASSVSKVITLSPEEVRFRVFIDAQPDITRDQILEMLSPAGFNAGDLLAVNSRAAARVPDLPPGVPFPPQMTQPATISYELASTQSADRLGAILQVLDQLQRAPRRGIASISFGAGLQVSAATTDLLRKNLTPLLLDDVKRKAGNLAQVAGGRLGNLLSFSEGPAGFGFATGAGAFLFPAGFVESNLRIVTTVSAQYSLE